MSSTGTAQNPAADLSLEDTALDVLIRRFRFGPDEPGNGPGILVSDDRPSPICTSPAPSLSG